MIKEDWEAIGIEYAKGSKDEKISREKFDEAAFNSSLEASRPTATGDVAHDEDIL